MIDHLCIENKSRQEDGPLGPEVVNGMIAILEQHVLDGVKSGQFKGAVVLPPRIPSNPDLSVEARGQYLVIRSFDLFQDEASPFGGVHRVRIDRCTGGSLEQRQRDESDRALRSRVANLETTLNLLLPILGLEFGDEPEVPAVPARRVIKKVGKK